MDTKDKIAAVEKYVEAFDKEDITLIEALYADDATVEDPVGSEIHNGIEAIKAFYVGALEMKAKLTLTGAPRCAGNAVAFPFTVVAGEMKLEVIDVFEFNEKGKVSAMKAYWGPENVAS